LAAAVLTWATLGPDARLGAATTERIVVNRHTGLAVDGFDPVAYFTDGAPKAGSPAYEHRFAGAVWRFRSEGNRAAFAERPDVYMPAFGGYDPLGVARGVARPGSPLVWAVSDEKLYLFFSAEARAKFMTGPDRIIVAAEGKWPAVQSALSP
jgi:hypothetical protein